MAVNGNHKSGNVVSFKSLGEDVQTILREAVEARNFSYSPYSKFKVGACIQTDEGKLYSGCNVENASFTVGTCAERCAFFKAISEGKTKFKKVAVIAHQEDEFTSPCGACRQFMNEFGDIEVYISKPNLTDVLVTSTNQLLPFAFVNYQ